MRRLVVAVTVIITFVLLFIFGCKTHRIVEKGDIEALGKMSNLYIDVRLHPEIIVNKRIVIFDVSNDMQAILNATDATDDTTDDILVSDKYIHDKERINQIRGYARFLKQSIRDELRIDLKQMEIPLAVYDVTADTWLEDQYVLIHTVKEYREGEFNLIQNISTRVNLLSRLVKIKNGQETMCYSFKSEYNAKANIEDPLEQMRIAKMGQFASKDIAAFIKKVYKNKSEQYSKQKDKDTVVKENNDGSDISLKSESENE